MEQQDPTFSFNLDTLENVSLGTYIQTLGKLLEQMPWLGFGEQLSAISDNYGYMKRYLQSGVDDKLRQSMYADMLSKAKQIASDSWLAIKLRSNNILQQLKTKGRKIDTDPADILATLQGFVQDIAMASIGLDNSEKAVSSIYMRHQTYLDNLFCSIVTNGNWSGSKAEDMTNVLLSPTVDIQDSMMLTSAITLAALISPDYHKIEALVKIYRNATDEHLRQRALAGWVFASLSCKLYRNDVERIIRPLMNDAVVRGEILEMAIQIVFCNNAEKDNEYLEKNVYPELIKNKDVTLHTRSVSEADEETLEDIINPDAADKRMDELEQSMRKITDMQKAGVDIYFGGFRQMKRFAFFYTVSNWFTPFNINHPVFEKISREVKDSSLLKLLLSSNSFCDSDKYSLILGMSSIFAKLPDNMKESVPPELVGSAAMGRKLSSADIRRLYLQDLYRFYKVFPQNIGLDDIFKRYPLILGEEPFRTLMPQEVRTLVRFLVKRGENALPLMLSVFDEGNENDEMLLAYIYMKRNDYGKAYKYYYNVYSHTPDNAKALKGAALTAFKAGDYSSACRLYDMLINEHGEQGLHHQLYYSMSMIKTGNVDQAVNCLFRLSFEYPDDAGIVRALALGLTLQGKVEQAINNYNTLKARGENTSSDNKALAYCYAYIGNWAKAVESLSSPSQIDNATTFYEDYLAETLPDALGISPADIDILADIANDKKL